MIAWLLACTASEPTVGESSPRVVVLVLDGTRIDETFGNGHSSAADQPTEAVLPQLREALLPYGALIQPGYATGITITGPGHCDLLSGRRQDFINYPNPNGPEAYLPDLPTLPELIQDTLLIGNTPLIEPLHGSLYPRGEHAMYTSVDGSDADVLRVLRERLLENPTRLTVANLHDIDRSGHYGESGDYLASVQSMDTALLSLWGWLGEQPDYADNTVLILTSDHGRHRLDEDESWRHHGDQCAGCRQVPMFLIGPGIRPGVVSEESHTLADLGATVAHLLETDLPYHQGRVMADILDDPPQALEHPGQVQPASAGGLLVMGERSGGVSTIILPNSSLSRPGEAPAAAVDDHAAFVCWRTLSMEPSEEIPWQGECARRTNARWQSIGFPVEKVWPLLSPALQGDGEGGLWLSFVDNDQGLVDVSAPLRLFHWQGGWSEELPGYIGSTGLMHPAMVITDDGLMVATAAGDAGLMGRYTRRIEVIAAAGESWEGHYVVYPDGIAEPDVAAQRLERPALWSDGASLKLVFLGHSEDRQTGVWQVDREGGLWSEPLRLDASGDVLPHITPGFTDDGEPVWAQLNAAGMVELCGTECVDTHAAYIDGMTVSGAEVMASLRSDGEPWTVQTFPW